MSIETYLRERLDILQNKLMQKVQSLSGLISVHDKEKIESDIRVIHSSQNELSVMLNLYLNKKIQ